MKSQIPFTKFTPDEISSRKPTARQIRNRRRTPVFALFENIRSMYNVGAMFRTSDAALVSRIFLAGITPQPPHRDMDKSALGATDVVPWEYCPNSLSAARRLKKERIPLIALELTHQSKPYTALSYPFPVCLVVGNEIDGISDELLKFCDFAIDIPMLGRANSLNVATAYGIALFEILRQQALA